MLTPEEQVKIRELQATGLTLRKIGSQFGVSPERVRQICDPQYKEYRKEYYLRKKAERFEKKLKMLEEQLNKL